MFRSPSLSSDKRARIHAVIVDDPSLTLRTVKHLRQNGFRVDDVHSPYPVHGMAEAIGMRDTHLAYATAAGGALGILLGLGFQAWTSTVDWPLNVGGKTDLALLALAPVTFELGVLCAAFATVLTVVIRSRHYPKGERPETQAIAAVTDDRFVILVREEDAAFDGKAFRRLLDGVGVREVMEAWKVY